LFQHRFQVPGSAGLKKRVRSIRFSERTGRERRTRKLKWMKGGK
jgi:hypothetical protein